MKKVGDFDFSEAAQIFAIANTPLFLVRKLRADAAVRGIVQEVPAVDILRSLEESVQGEPESSEQAVRPYALLVALSLKPSSDDLARSSCIQAPHYSWFNFIRQYLIDTYDQVSQQVIVPPGELPAPAIKIESTIPAQALRIEAQRPR